MAADFALSLLTQKLTSIIGRPFRGFSVETEALHGGGRPPFAVKNGPRAQLSLAHAGAQVGGFIAANTHAVDRGDQSAEAWGATATRTEPSWRGNRAFAEVRVASALFFN